jgi:phage gpG-like protein
MSRSKNPGGISFGPGKYIDESEKVAKAVRKAGWDAMRRLGFLVRKTAQKSILHEAGPSEAGTPPHTHGKRPLHTSGRFHTKQLHESHAGLLPASILYATPDEGLPSVIVGTAENLIGTLGGLHEHGGEDRRGVSYPARPFMGPALAEEVGELPGLLADKLKNL